MKFQFFTPLLVINDKSFSVSVMFIYLTRIHCNRPMQWYLCLMREMMRMRAAICVSIANVYLSRLNVLK